MKMTALVVSVLAGLILLPAAAQAVCTKANMEVARVDGNVITGTGTIFLRPASTSGASFSVVVGPGVRITRFLFPAPHFRTKVTVTGSAASCPASGSIGTLQSFSVAP